MSTVYEMAVTFEFEVRAPVTWRGEVEAATLGKALGVAMRQARGVLRPVGWRSFVCVCLSQRPGAARGLVAAVSPAVLARLAEGRRRRAEERGASSAARSSAEKA
jgi:hypothetical protein